MLHGWNATTQKLHAIPHKSIFTFAIHFDPPLRSFLFNVHSEWMERLREHGTVHSFMQSHGYCFESVPHTYSCLHSGRDGRLFSCREHGIISFALAGCMLARGFSLFFNFFCRRTDPAARSPCAFSMLPVRHCSRAKWTRTPTSNTTRIIACRGALQIYHSATWNTVCEGRKRIQYYEIIITL